VIEFQGSVGVDRSKMRREGVPNRGASMPKTTRGESNLTRGWERRLREAERS